MPRRARGPSLLGIDPRQEAKAGDHPASRITPDTKEPA
jgi:hypothetical protein